MEQVVEQVQGENIGEALPLILFSAFFRPLPFEVGNAFSALAAVENVVLLLLTIIAATRFRFAFLRHPMISWSLLFSLLWAAFHGAIMIANFGAGMRYKLQILGFVVMILFLLVSPEGRQALMRVENEADGPSLRGIQKATG